MTCEEIFKSISEHMIKGLMVHSQLADYYDFLGLEGYRDCHEYHYMHESCMYRKLCRYYVNHYNKLIPEAEFEQVSEIPESWYKYTRQDVDVNTKKGAIKNALTKWVEWETDTKKFYCEMYKEIVENGSIATAKFFEDYIKDVDEELEKATKYWLHKEAIGYDISVIIAEQKEKRHKYSNKLKEVGDVLC